MRAISVTVKWISFKVFFADKFTFVFLFKVFFADKFTFVFDKLWILKPKNRFSL